KSANFTKLNAVLFFLSIAHFLTLSSEEIPAVLRTRVIFAASSQLTCQISFYYWIGQVNGILIVELHTHSGRTSEIIWQEKEGIKNQWQRAVITINNTLNSEISIQGQIFESWAPGETIAIDDLSVTEGCFLAFDSSGDQPAALENKESSYGSTILNDNMKRFHCVISGAVSAVNPVFQMKSSSVMQPTSPSVPHMEESVSSNFKIQVCDWNSDELASHVSWIPVKELLHHNFTSTFLRDGRNDTNGYYKWTPTRNNTSYKSTHLNDSLCHCFRENCHFSFYYFMVDSSVLKAVLYTNKKFPKGTVKNCKSEGIRRVIQGFVVGKETK
ncbi:MAM and LDL-receptor class A domain-containing protein 1, partial [Varanus komodoensis]